jgi:hypothetical protein
MHSAHGSQVALEDGTTTLEDDHFLTTQIRQPDQVTVTGYPKG